MICWQKGRDKIYSGFFFFSVPPFSILITLFSFFSDSKTDQVYFQKGFCWKRCIQVCCLAIYWETDIILSGSDSVDCLLLGLLCYFMFYFEICCILFPISCEVSFRVSMWLLPRPNVALVSHCLPHPSVFRTCSLSLLCQIVSSISLSASQHVSSVSISKCMIVFRSIVSKFCL